MTDIRLSSGFIRLVHTGSPVIRLGSSLIRVIHSGDPYTRINSVIIRVIRSKHEKTNLSYSSKLTSYVAGIESSDNKAQASNLSSYVVARFPFVTSTSMLNSYAVLTYSPTSLSKTASYAVGELRLVTTKLSAYAALSIPLQFFTLTSFVALRAPFAVDKLTSYVALGKDSPLREVTTKLTTYAALIGSIKVTQTQSYVVANDPTPRYVETAKLASYIPLGLVINRTSKLTSYAALIKGPSNKIDAPKLAAYVALVNLNPKTYLPLITSDVITGGKAASRSPRVTADVITGGNARSRLSLNLADVITGGLPSSRCSFIILEILTSVPREPHMINPDTHLFPTLLGLSFDVNKTPNFLTGISESQPGREVRRSFTEAPRWDFELSYEFLRDSEGNNLVDGKTELKKLAGFFLNRRGRFEAFLFKDPDDHFVQNNFLGASGGVTRNFLLKRDFGGFQETVGQLDTSEPLTVLLRDTAGEPHTIPSSSPYTVQVVKSVNFIADFGVQLVAGGSELTRTFNAVPGPGQYYVDGPTGTYTFNAAQAGAAIRIRYSYQVYEGADFEVIMPNELSFDEAPKDGIEVFASFHFFFVCRFDEDAQEYSKFLDKLWELQSCTFKSLLP